MQLSEEIRKNYEDNNSEFARRIGDSPQNVFRYATGASIPRPDKMERIVEVTEGRVQPNDFYALRMAKRVRNLLLTTASPLAMQVAGIPTERRKSRAA